MKKAAVAFMVLAAVAAPAFAGSCPTTNLMPAFFAFSDATAAETPERRANRFVDEFAPRHPEFFKSDIFGSDAEFRGYAQRLFDPAKPAQFGSFAALTEQKFRALADAFPAKYAAAEKAFAQAFPDFDCQTPILFGPSFMRFAGSGGTGPDGIYRMRFGIDMLSVLQSPSDLPVLFSHELFHVYHGQALGTIYKQNLGVVWWGAWVEGLASYVSYRITPAATPKQALAWPPDLYDRMQAPGVIKQAATQMLLDLDAKNPTYGLWFHTGKSYPGLPSCAGYYMGFKIAEALAKDHLLQDLAHLSPDELKPLIRAALEKMAR